MDAGKSTLLFSSFIKVALFTTLIILLNSNTGCDKKKLLQPKPSKKFYNQLVHRWAPVHYQDVHNTSRVGGLNGVSDYVTRINYDGEWDTSNNWDNLDESYVDLSASCYYSVAETPDYWFLIYAFYHPRDWSFKYWGDHENDLEGVLVVVKRPVFYSDNNFGELKAMISQAHDDFHVYENDGTIKFDEANGELHPKTWQESKGHGMYCVTEDNYQFPGGDGIIYYPAPEARIPGGIPEGPNDDHVNYELINIFKMNGLWSRRDYKKTFSSCGTFKGSHQHKAKAPWKWRDDDDRSLPRGLIAYDPQAFVKFYLPHLESLESIYTIMPYDDRCN